MYRVQACSVQPYPVFQPCTVFQPCHANFTLGKDLPPGKESPAHDTTCSPMARGTDFVVQWIPEWGNSLLEWQELVRVDMTMGEGGGSTTHVLYRTHLRWSSFQRLATAPAHYLSLCAEDTVDVWKCDWHGGEDGAHLAYRVGEFFAFVGHETNKVVAVATAPTVAAAALLTDENDALVGRKVRVFRGTSGGRNAWGFWTCVHQVLCDEWWTPILVSCHDDWVCCCGMDADGNDFQLSFKMIQCSTGRVVCNMKHVHVDELECRDLPYLAVAPCGRDGWLVAGNHAVHYLDVSGAWETVRALPEAGALCHNMHAVSRYRYVVLSYKRDCGYLAVHCAILPDRVLKDTMSPFRVHWIAAVVAARQSMAT